MQDINCLGIASRTKLFNNVSHKQEFKQSLTYSSLGGSCNYALNWSSLNETLNNINLLDDVTIQIALPKHNLKCIHIVKDNGQMKQLPKIAE